MRSDPPETVLLLARDAFRRHDWPGAYAGFRDARAAGLLPSDDLAALADSAWWLGHLDDAITAFEEAYRAYLGEGRSRDAAMIAFTIGYTRSMRGEMALASGWIARTARLLEGEPDCVERGFLLYLEMEDALERGDVEAAIRGARAMQEMGARFNDTNLAALGILTEGRGMVRKGEIRRGVALLDEAMLTAIADDLDPAWAGHIYCHLIATCEDLGDLRRAAEWTDATMRWCDTMPAAGPFPGICRVHRARIHQVRGHWDQSERDAAGVYAGVPWFDMATLAEAHYQVGEVRRLRGDYDRAMDAYGQAHDLGRDPQPGLALIQAARGRGVEAATALHSALAATSSPARRSRLLAALAEVALAAGDLAAAGAASGELDTIANSNAGTGLVAMAHQVSGMLLLETGRPDEAATVLRKALEAWRALSAPYDVARVQALLADARDALGDPAGAARERDAALAAFERLGARPDADAARAADPVNRLPCGLSEREAQVLKLVTAGMTNREIGEALFISPRTVGRHLESIYAKISVSSRASATAWAMAHDLLPPDG